MNGFDGPAAALVFASMGSHTSTTDDYDVSDNGFF